MPEFLYRRGLGAAIQLGLVLHTKRTVFANMFICDGFQGAPGTYSGNPKANPLPPLSATTCLI